MKYLAIVLLFLKIASACEEIDLDPEAALDIKYLKIADASCFPIKELILCKQRIDRIESDSMMANIRTKQIILEKEKLNLSQIKDVNAPYQAIIDSASIDVDSIKSKQIKLNGTSEQYYSRSALLLICMLLIMSLSIFAPIPRRLVIEK